MPNLRGITTLINNTLQATCFSTQKFQGGSYSDLAYMVIEEPTQENQLEIRRPAVVANSGESIPVNVDDTYPVVVYHRNTNLFYEDEQTESFGDAGQDIRETADMVLICIGDRDFLQVVQEDVVSAIWANIPRNLTASQLSALQLDKVIIEPGEVNVQPMEVWQQEISNVAYGLDPQHFMLSIKYRIISIYNKNCFQFC